MWTFLFLIILTIGVILLAWYSYRLHLYADSLEERLKIKDNQIDAINKFLKGTKIHLNGLKNEFRINLNSEVQALRREIKREANRSSTKSSYKSNNLNKKIDTINKKEKKEDEYGTQPNDR